MQWKTYEKFSLRPALPSMKVREHLFNANEESRVSLTQPLAAQQRRMGTSF
jgi:hypothetical protein